MTDEPLVIKLSSHYYLNRLDRLIRQLTPLMQLNEPRRVEMDLTGLTGIGPTCLVLGGFAVCQHFRTRDIFEIAIVDLGIGIRESLARNAELKAPEDCAGALDLALTPRITSTPERNAGLGLFVTAALLQGNEGQFYLRSGDAVAMRGTVTSTTTTPVALPGTLTTLQVKTDRPLNIEQVYARFKKELGDADD